MRVSTDTGIVLQDVKSLIIEQESPFGFDFSKEILTRLLGQVDTSGITRTKVLKVVFAAGGWIEVTVP